MKVDKAVCTTNDTLDDLQRTIRYETVFTTLVENKILAIKRECEAHEKKELERREQACFAGRFFRKRRLGSRDKSTTNCNETVAGVDEQQTFVVQYVGNNGIESDAAAATATVILANENTGEAIESSMIDESGNNTHEANAGNTIKGTNLEQCINISDDTYPIEPAQRLRTNDVKIGDDDAKKAIADNGSIKSDNSCSIKASNSSQRGKVTLAVISGSDVDPTKVHRPKRTGAHVKVVDGSPGSATSRLEVSVISEDGIRRKPSSDTTISYPSTGKQTTFSAPVVSTVATLDHERHRLRLLEAKSISAQCSPIFPRHSAVDSVATQVSYRIEAESGGGVMAGARSKALKLFSRQNTSDDSVNVTFSSAVVNDDLEEAGPNSEGRKTFGASGKRSSKKDKMVAGRKDTSLGFISNFNQLTAHNNLPVIATQLRAVNSAKKLQRYLTTAVDGSDCIQRNGRPAEERFHPICTKEKTVAEQNSDEEDPKKTKRKFSKLNHLANLNYIISIIRLKICK